MRRVLVAAVLDLFTENAVSGTSSFTTDGAFDVTSGIFRSRVWRQPVRRGPVTPRAVRWTPVRRSGSVAPRFTFRRALTRAPRPAAPVAP